MSKLKVFVFTSSFCQNLGSLGGGEGVSLPSHSYATDDSHVLVSSSDVNLHLLIFKEKRWLDTGFFSELPSSC